MKIAAYEWLRQDRGLDQHLLGALLRGVSPGEYQEVCHKSCESRGAIRRKAIEASVEQLQRLQERVGRTVDILVIYVMAGFPNSLTGGTLRS